MRLITQIFSVVDAWVSAALAGVKPGTITNMDLNCSAKRAVTKGGHVYYHISNSLAVMHEEAVFSVTIEVIRPNHRHETVIVTDGWFESLTPLTKTFVMSHEQAHIDNGDFHPGLLCGARSNGPEIEYKADEVAAKYVGPEQAMRSFEEIRSVIASSTFICSKSRRAALLDELDKRSRHISRMLTK